MRSRDLWPAREDYRLRSYVHAAAVGEVTGFGLVSYTLAVEAAVHLEKGCYRGQETVARVHTLGRPPRRLTMLHLDGSESLLDSLEAPVAVVCPVFPATGRTLYMGHLFVGDRLLSQSGMERHPLTPMTDPDIRRWLARQSSHPVGHVVHASVASFR